MKSDSRDRDRLFLDLQRVQGSQLGFSALEHILFGSRSLWFVPGAPLHCVVPPVPRIDSKLVPNNFPRARTMDNSQPSVGLSGDSHRTPPRRLARNLEASRG